MASSERTLPAPPRVEVHPVEDLVRFVLAGQVRIPAFQRGWKWDARRVRDLLDSVYRGYPIGSMLMWKRPGEAGTLRVGPVEQVVDAREDAWAVVDGQQRLTALVGTLAHPDPRPDPDDAFAVWFDPDDDDEPFKPAPPDRTLPASWVPVSLLRDSSALADWCSDRDLFRDQKETRQRVFDAGRRIREHRVPVTIVEAEERTVREIFRRSSLGGLPMEEAEVFSALDRGRPGRVEDLAEEATRLRMGTIERHKLLQCVMAVRGLDVTRRSDDRGGRKLSGVELEQALEDTAPALRATLVFLLRDARIPHLRVLPYPVPLVVLTRFFHLHPEPKPRSRELLVRWVWRGLLTAAHEHGERTALRRAVEAIASDEEGSVQGLLALVPKEAPPDLWWLGADFDGRSAASRIAGLGLASLRPADPESGQPVDVAGLFELDGANPFRRLTRAAGPSGASAANRVLLRAPADVRRLLDPTTDAAVLASHAISREIAEDLERGEIEAGLARRRERLADVVTTLGRRLAGWGRPDRPSLDFLLREPEEAA